MLHVGIHVGCDLTTTPGALDKELDELQQCSIAVNLVALNPVIHHSLKTVMGINHDQPKAFHLYTQLQSGQFTCTPNPNLDSSLAHPTPIWTVHLHSQPQFGQFTCTPNPNLDSSLAHPTPIWTVHLHSQPHLGHFTCIPNHNLDTLLALFF